MEKRNKEINRNEKGAKNAIHLRWVRSHIGCFILFYFILFLSTIGCLINRAYVGLRLTLSPATWPPLIKDKVVGDVEDKGPPASSQV
jgi:hypothetical protein